MIWNVLNEPLNRIFLFSKQKGEFSYNFINVDIFSSPYHIPHHLKHTHFSPIYKKQLNF